MINILIFCISNYSLYTTAGCMSHWPALSRWGDLDYLVAVAGGRTVPVELGRSYAQEDWSQRLMTVRDFVTRYITSPGTDIGYLAQHQLFDQVGIWAAAEPINKK